jgi:UDP-N-acetylglucosamine--N-acetylmuramyl-(pentapeptide) pyrophosphoryl-undecaprenol N-acetylglucosamine transferase
MAEADVVRYHARVTMIRRIAFAVGDTAGHVMPALAIAEAYDSLAADVQVTLFAAPGGPASRLAATAGRQFEIVSASALARAGPLARIGAVARVVRGIPAARRLLRRAGTRLVIGTGGYASGAVLLAARSLGLATAVVEPNAAPGLANRLLRPWMDRAYVSSEASARFFSPEKALVLGTPVSPALARRLQTARVAPALDEPIHVLVTGASRGEQFLGAEMPAFLGVVQRLGVTVQVWHQSGTLNQTMLEREYERHGVWATVTGFLDDIAAAYEWAQFVIARAGAGTLAELAIAGLPALVVPLADAAADHQSANAAGYAASGAALWLRETGWNREAVAQQVAQLLSLPDRWTAMSTAARQAARPDAARAIVDDCERLMEGRW